MRLENKETGIIGELHFEPDKEYHFKVVTEDPADVMIYKKLADLYADWEDYEEPKGIQCIYYVNHFDTVKLDGVIVGFGSKEEAELAVLKLKAWKRLKDKGFRFTGYGHYDDSGDESPAIAFEYPDLDEMFYNKQVVADLDLLFGGEE